MKKLTIFSIAAIFAIACTPDSSDELEHDPQKIETMALDLVKEKEAAWNRGDLDAYMQGYWHSDSLRFVSGANTYYGWETTLDRYKQQYPNNEAMGRLSFSEMDVTVLSDSAALLFGKWQLHREEDRPWGLFTLLIQKTDRGWKIVHDHTSAAE